jgi:sulfur carrier protein ThiS
MPPPIPFLQPLKLPMKILLINNTGAGFGDNVEIPDGMTVRDLFKREVPTGKATDYLIRVNRQPCASDQVLREGDRVSITPTKIEGAL